MRPPRSFSGSRALQRDAAKDVAVWLQVISSGPGLEGHVSGAEVMKLNNSRKATPAGTLLDPKGIIGPQYAACHTPTMAVIDAKGMLAYFGAIDSDSNWHPDSIKGARNHVRAALADIKAGRSVEVSKTRAYGCSDKYGS